MKQILILTAFLLPINLTLQQSFYAQTLEKKWQTPAELKTPESVCYDQQRNVLYVSNIDGGPSDKDNKGFITALSPDGKILQHEWCSGLNAPKGMGIAGNYLYVSDINEVIQIDILQQKITHRFSIAEAKFLNDVAVGKDGIVYISDMNDNAIYMIKDGAAELFLKSAQLTQPNGLYVQDNKLLVGLRDRIVSIHLKSKEIADYVLNTGGIDGIVPDGRGNLLISDWMGSIHLVHPKNPKQKLMDTTPEKINAADIEFIAGQHLLLVPTFSDNRVMAYEVK